MFQLTSGLSTDFEFFTRLICLTPTYFLLLNPYASFLPIFSTEIMVNSVFLGVQVTGFSLLVIHEYEPNAWRNPETWMLIQGYDGWIERHRLADKAWEEQVQNILARQNPHLRLPKVGKNKPFLSDSIKISNDTLSLNVINN